MNLLVILFLVVTTLIGYFLNKTVIRWSADHTSEKAGYQQRLDYVNRVSDDIKAAKDIRLYQMSGWLTSLYENNMKGLASWYRRYTKKVFGVSAAVSGLSLLREGTAYAYLLYLVLDTQISVAEFVLYTGVIAGFSTWLDGILAQLNEISRINLSINYLRGYLEYPEKYQRETGKDTKNLETFPKIIELKGVSYRYPGAEEDTLKQIDLKIQPAEHLAIVGLNGAGKTTLVKLICGLIEPTQGCVLYDGIDIREYDRTKYYKLFSAVFQQFSILPVSIEEIVAEAPLTETDSEKVIQCLKKADLYDKILTLPKRLQSEFGKTIHDDGVDFSGGEIQKLLLARALYKNAPVMLLDEPTAALDPIAESKLYETYHSIMSSHSTVFISHRLASTRFCNRILLLDHGKICEEGTHEDLLKKQGQYYQLFETQAKYYRDHPERGDEQ